MFDCVFSLCWPVYTQALQRANHCTEILQDKYSIFSEVNSKLQLTTITLKYSPEEEFPKSQNLCYRDSQFYE